MRSPSEGSSKSGSVNGATAMARALVSATFRQAALSAATLAFLAFSITPTNLLHAQKASFAARPDAGSGEVSAENPASMQSLTPTSSATNIPAPAIELSPEDMGNLYMARRRYQAALESFRQIPNKSAEIWNKMGIANQQMFQASEARKDYETSLKLDGKNADVLNNLATIYYSEQDYTSAARLYKKAIKLRPDSAIFYKNLGTDLVAANKYRQGLESYRKALELDPQIFERSSILRIGEPTPAQKRGAMNYYMAQCYVLAGNLELAVQYLRLAMDQGFADRRKILADKQFASLQGLTSFQQLISEQQRSQ